MTELTADVVRTWAVISGSVLASSTGCTLRRAIGVVALGWGLLAASPAIADQTVPASDNGTVECDASRRALTRFSLKDDRFAAVSKVASGDAAEDFSVVHEPTRGDVYISVPDRFPEATISFFGTTRKGFVYKFNCKIAGSDAKQVFVTNTQADAPSVPRAKPVGEDLPLAEQVTALVRAMFEQRPLDAYEIADLPHMPVKAGDLQVQLLSEYRGLQVIGKILRIQNVGSAPVTLNEDLIAGEGAIAVSVSSPSLGPGQATGAYVVVAEEL